MLRSILSGNFNLNTVFAYIISALIIIFFVLPFHEAAHAFAANKLGDHTAKSLRRLTFNPLAHIDPLGALCILLFGFGWAKPVPVNMHNFRRPKSDMALTAAAGPLSNILAAMIGAFFLNLSYFIIYSIQTAAVVKILSFVIEVLWYFISINITLAAFNLIPIPPLDGSRILSAFLSNRAYYTLMSLERYFFIVVIALSSTGVFDAYISTVGNAILRFLIEITGIFFFGI